MYRIFSNLNTVNAVTGYSKVNLHPFDASFRYICNLLYKILYFVNLNIIRGENY